MQNTYSKNGLVLDMSVQKFQETGRDIIRDKSRHMNHGMCVNETNIIQTKEGICAVSLNGVNDYVNCLNDASLNPIDAITVECWAKPDAVAMEGSLYAPIIRRNNTYLLRLDKEISDGNFIFFIYDGTSWEPGAYSGSQLVFGVWHHVVGTYDRQYVKIYVNGKFKGSSIRTDAMPLNGNNTVMGFWNTDFFPGLIDEVRIYNRALSVEEIRGNMFASKRYRYMRGVQKCGVQ